MMPKPWEVVCAVTSQLEKLSLCFVVVCLWPEQPLLLVCTEEGNSKVLSQEVLANTSIWNKCRSRAQRHSLLYSYIHLVCTEHWTWFCCVFILAHKGKACQPLTSAWKVTSEICITVIPAFAQKQLWGRE